MKKTKEVLSLIVLTIILVLAVSFLSISYAEKMESKEVEVEVEVEEVEVALCLAIKTEKNEVVEDEAIKEAEAEAEENKDSFRYYSEINMPKEIQEYLFKLCKERGLDYEKTLALIALESNFNPGLVSKTNDYGYMQVNKVNHKRMRETLGTENKPLDPYINLNWGTYLLSELNEHWKVKGIKNEGNGEILGKLDKHILSSYNRGLGGFSKHGYAKKYLSLVENRYSVLFKS